MSSSGLGAGPSARCAPRPASPLLVALSILFLNYVVLSTDKARSYREHDPNLAECRDGLAWGWTILADTGRGALQTAISSDGDDWVDASNDEGALVAVDGRRATRLRCALLTTFEKPPAAVTAIRATGPPRTAMEL